MNRPTGLVEVDGFDGTDFILTSTDASRPDIFAGRKDIILKDYVDDDGVAKHAWCTRASWGLFKKAVESERHRRAQERAAAINNGTIPRPRGYPNSKWIAAEFPEWTAKDPNGFAVWGPTEEPTEESKNYFQHGADYGNHWLWDNYAIEGWPLKEIQRHFNVKPGYFEKYRKVGENPPVWRSDLEPDEILENGRIRTPFYIQKML
jgi:hypothetical protein